MTVEPLSPKQDEAILALLSETSIAKAAAKVDVTERTIYNWLKEPAFSAAYRQARREAFGQSIAFLQRYSSMAVQTLAKVMTDPSSSPSAKVSAANSMLTFAREGIELDDLAARVEALERTAKEKTQ